MDLLTKFDVSIINTPPNKDRLRNASQIEDDKRQANLDRAKLQRMKRRHKRLRSVAVQKYKNSSNAMESKKRVMQAGFDYFRSYAKLVVPGFDWSSITVSDVNKYTQQGK
ncbi:unnamed protein product [Prunus brigantina]